MNSLNVIYDVNDDMFRGRKKPLLSKQIQYDCFG